MTFALGAFGPNAGLAAFRALKLVETVARGSIGGFITYAAITEDGELLRHETQRGGTGTLFTEGETCGVEPPERTATAIAAGLIASGPDRPDPLAQFVTADGAVGLVTGHRLPNQIGADGRPLSVAAPAHLHDGIGAAAAVQAVMAANEQADAGLLAVDLQGGVKARNSARVARRPDLGGGRRQSADGSMVVETLQNSIRPYPSLAAVAADLALETMMGEARPTGWFTINAGTPVEIGTEAAIEVGGDDIATRLVITDPLVIAGHHLCAPVYPGSPVRRDGATIGDTPIGVTLWEPLMELRDATVVSIIGQPSLKVPYTTDPVW